MRIAPCLLLLLAVAWVGCDESSSATPPSVREPSTLGYKKTRERIRYPLALVDFQRELFAASGTEPRTLRLDLLKASIRGELDVGPFFLPDGRVDPRLRGRSDVRNGETEIRIPSAVVAEASLDIRGWEHHMILGLRLRVDTPQEDDQLYERRLHVNLKGDVVQPVVSVVEGPMLALVTSDHPEWMVVAFEIDRPGRAAIEVEGMGRFDSTDPGHRHEIRIEGLQPTQTYRYRALAWAESDSASTPWFEFQSAPRPGEGATRIMFAGDSRAGAGFGRSAMLGVNRNVLGSLVKDGLRRDPHVLLFGGDLVSGYPQRPVDFQTELRSWKQGVLPVGLTRAVYSAIGNHDAVIHRWYRDDAGGLRMDRWPYETESSEAIFAAELVHPTNGPTSLPDLPSYDETIYTFTYGPVRVIVFNNNYWYTTHRRIEDVGGCPEGYLLPGQLDWIEAEVARAEADSTIRYTLLCAQEPVWPVAGHAADATWHDGNNTRRARRWTEQGQIEELGPGIIENRNRFWSLLSNANKVAAVLTSDEHNYSRTLIESSTPTGIPATDDRDGDGTLFEAPFSPNPEFRLPTWSIVSGGAGAPFYRRESVPWNDAVAAFSMRFHYLLLEATAEAISLTTYGLDGLAIDHVDDLMAARNGE